MRLRNYQVKEIFGPTIQGEGALIGMPVVFLRFAGCNLWNGKMETKADSPCFFCDTDFVGGEKMTVDDILARLTSYRANTEWIVITGGEPLLQLDKRLIDALHSRHWKINLETNGTVPCDYLGSIDHVSFCPKTAPDTIRIPYCDSLKILWPLSAATTDMYKDFPSGQKYIQPVDINNKGFRREVLPALYQLGSNWRLSPQLHKLIEVE
jgi:organic radical activating enzyme